MPENMNLSINGQTRIPPGFRFHPTEEELLHYYLRKKVTYEKIDLDVIREVDLNKLEPWDIQERCRIGTGPQNDWYFFSHKDKKYPTGTRTNRATAAGFWKATGRDKIIYSGYRRIGLRKTLVFYKGRAPHGQKSDWIMHEYRLDDSTNDDTSVSHALNSNGDSNAPEEGWVICRVFKKKNYQKTLDVPKTSIDSSKMHQSLISSNTNDDVLDQILLYMGRSCNNKMEHQNRQDRQAQSNSSNKFGNADAIKNETLHQISFSSALYERFLHLPRLDSPINSMIPNNICTDTPYDHDPRTNCSNQDQHDDQSFDEMMMESEPSNNNNNNNNQGDGCGPTSDLRAEINDWAALDRLVASQLNGQNPVFGLFPDDDDITQISQQRMNNRPNQSNLQIYSSSGNGYWSSSSASSSDPLRHLLA